MVSGHTGIYINFDPKWANKALKPLRMTDMCNL